VKTNPRLRADTSDCCGITQMQQEALVPAATAWQMSYSVVYGNQHVKVTLCNTKSNSAGRYSYFIDIFLKIKCKATIPMLDLVGLQFKIHL
jgi:hypothetical protein